ncbi:MAG: hypothetical protein MMC33_002671 [Icmadophila ericetorum]|nr:hypothetical protein [Icmadophila ericetorum]
MADPFEVRMRFTSQLQHLNASVTSSQKAAHYALKYRDMDEDLHSCILEQLEKNSMNNRANIMYFIEHLCDMAHKENHVEFVRMMQKDIYRVVDAVAPSDGSGAANVLQALLQKSHLIPETVSDLEAALKERDVALSDTHPALSPIDPNSQNPRDGVHHISMQVTPKASGTNGAAGVGMRLDKRQIEQRIEEDRERHKRLRESIWAVGGEDDVEFERLWEEVSEIGEDDYIAAEEDAIERKVAAEVDL